MTGGVGGGEDLGDRVRRDTVPLVDVVALEESWNRSWSGCPPVPRLLGRRHRPRWARFHALPGGRRYATSDLEHAEILHRCHALVSALLAEAAAPDGDLVAITCSWSGTASPTPRDVRLVEVMPHAVYWRSDDLAREPGYHSWEHRYACLTRLDDRALDQLLLLVADDLTDGVVLTDTTCAWVVRPFDGGTDVFADTPETRDLLINTYADWWSGH